MWRWISRAADADPRPVSVSEIEGFPADWIRFDAATPGGASLLADMTAMAALEGAKPQAAGEPMYTAADLIVAFDEGWLRGSVHRTTGFQRAWDQWEARLRVRRHAEPVMGAHRAPAFELFRDRLLVAVEVLLIQGTPEAPWFAWRGCEGNS